MNKICTTIEQSKKLIELGIDVNTADMFWADGERPAVWNNKDTSLDEMDVPAWSLAALIGVLPLGTETYNITDGNKMYYYVEIYTKEICMRLKRMNKPEFWLSSERHENLVDACVEMILKLKENDLL